MPKLMDFMLLSDVDGTLLNRGGVIPERNLAAIRRFTEAGGRFGIATGRSKGLLLDVIGDLPINAPCVLYNGGALYDVKKDELLMELFLPDQAAGYVQELKELFPDFGLLIIKDDSYYHVLQELAFSDFYATRDPVHFRSGILGEVPMPWYKVLFQVREGQYDRFFETVREKQYPGVRFVATNGALIEMLPEQSSKGYALQKMVEMELARPQYLAAIGDFYNDWEMIEMAGIGATLEDSPEDLRQMADLVVGNCDQGAVADLIEHLEGLCD